MGKRDDLIDCVFGEWKVIGYAYSTGNHAYWECRCNCGTEKVVRSDTLKLGQSKGCGKCKHNRFITKGEITFGFTEKRECFIIDTDDLETIKGYCWHKDSVGYIATHIKDTLVRSHSIIIEGCKGFSIDHINRNSLDNRKSNLRICTQQQNTFNQGLAKNNTSGFKGVTRKNNKWIAQIMHNRKHIYLGIFNSPEEAATAYNIKAIQLFGEYAYLNKLVRDVQGGDAYAR